MASSDLLKNLNEQQAAAVSAVPGPTLVVAGPGSGKTAVLTRRVAYLIQEFGVSPYSIMAVTFTNKAAKEMLERIDSLLSGRIKGLSIGTFHSVCARILRREAEHLGIKPSYAIYDTSDQIAIMKQAIEDLKLDPDKNSPRRILSKVSNAKNELIEPDQYPAELYQEKIVRDLYKRYQLLLRNHNALDFDDLLMQTAILFRDHPDVLERYRYYYQHLLVDEFQDTNTAQYKLVTLLADTEPSQPRQLFCVGDPDQSIYRFRGADYRNIGNFMQDYPDANVILLEQNYRSHQIILDAAMAVIDKSPNRIKKNLNTTRKDGQKVILRQTFSEDEEAMWVVQTILEMKFRGQYNLSDISVMYRTNAQSRALEEMFVRSGVAYKLIGGTRFYDRKEVKDVLAYLRVINNPDDNLNLERIINEPKRGIGKQTVGKLLLWANERRMSLYDALQAIRNGVESPFPPKTNKPLIEFAGLIETWRQLRETKPATYILNEVLEKTAYKSYLLDGTPEGIERAENVSELQGMAQTAGEVRLAEFLEEVSLVSDIDNYNKESNSVTLMTLHAAKGLEFSVVFIVGLEETILPHQMSMEDPEQMEEERRLMYVGITRAKDVLFLSWSLTRALYGRGDRMIPSRFLEDIPHDLTSGSPVVKRADRTGMSAQQRQDQEQLPEGFSKAWSIPKPPARNDRPARTSSANTSWSSAPPPAYAAASSRSPKSMYKSGQKVLHQKFGEGTIINSNIRSGYEEVTVQFIGHGIKRLDASTANLVMLDE
ncbi:MAG: UvrD-helicase domain-containing protein [Anaerolineae bacterium]